MTDEVLPETKFAEEVAAELPRLNPLVRPAGQAEHYQFFSNRETGQHWKAKLVVQEARKPDVASGVDLAPANLAITITVSPVDDKGKALRENDLPIVIDSWTHTFNEVEMAQEGFDPMARVMLIVAERIKTGEARLAGVDKVRSLVGSWATERKLSQ